MEGVQFCVHASSIHLHQAKHATLGRSNIFTTGHAKKNIFTTGPTSQSRARAVAGVVPSMRLMEHTSLCTRAHHLLAVRAWASTASFSPGTRRERVASAERAGNAAALVRPFWQTRPLVDSNEEVCELRRRGWVMSSWAMALLLQPACLHLA